MNSIEEKTMFGKYYANKHMFTVLSPHFHGFIFTGEIRSSITRGF
jgi:hypothetical protein